MEVVEMVSIRSVRKDSKEIEKVVTSKTGEIILETIWEIEEDEVEKNIGDINGDVSALGIVKFRSYAFFEVGE